MRPVKPHTLRHNALERSPHRILIIDSEAKIAPYPWADQEGYDLLGADRFEQAGVETPQELQVLRCWAARLLRRHGHQPREPRAEDVDGTTADELADTIERLTRADTTLWVFAHNLSYDLALTGLTLRLLERGWVLGRHNLASDAPWAFLRHRSKALRLADSWSWLPAPVETLGELMATRKRPLPAADAPLAVWLERCRRDVDITARALERLMDEWDERRLGSWSLTGPASAWNTFLHAKPAQPVAVDPDPEARAFERRALYSGRRDLTRVGTLTAGPYVLLDLRECFAAVCAVQRLPVWRSPELEIDESSLDLRRGDLGSMLAECVVSVDTPRYPVRLGRAILHPTGTFATVLAGPELEQASRRNELIRVGRARRYQLGTRMQAWAQWLLPLLRDESGAVDPLLQVFLKQASRTVPGRWGMLIQREGERNWSPEPGWRLEPAVFGPELKAGAWWHCRGEAVQLIRDQEADDAFPAVLAFIQSWVRVLLQHLLDTLGEADWCSVNTDGAWVPARRLEVMHTFNAQVAPFALRIKATTETLRLRTPQHWRTDRERSYAGIPRTAREIAPEVFSFQTWPKLAGQMRRGDPRGYVRECREVDLSSLPVTRWVAEDGCTRPPALAWDAERGNVLLTPPAAGCEAHGAPWRPQQHKALRLSA